MDFIDFASYGIDHVFTFVKKVLCRSRATKRSSKTLERQEILETRMGHTICCLIIPIFWVLNILTEKKDSSNNRWKSSEQDRFVDE